MAPRGIPDELRVLKALRRHCGGRGRAVATVADLRAATGLGTGAVLLYLARLERHGSIRPVPAMHGWNLLAYDLATRD